MDWHHPCEINTAQVEETGLFHTECQQCSCHSHFLPLESRLCNWSLQDSCLFHRQSNSNWLDQAIRAATTANGLGMAIHEGCKYLNSFPQECPAWHKDCCSFALFVGFFWLFFKEAVFTSLLSLASSLPLKLCFFCPPHLGNFCLRCCFWWFFFFLTHFSFFWPQFCFYNEAMLIRAESLWVFFKHRERSLWNGWGCFFHPMAAVQKVWSIYFPITIKPFPG